MSIDRRGFLKSGGAATAMAFGGSACATIACGAEKLAYLGGTPVLV